MFNPRELRQPVCYGSAMRPKLLIFLTWIFFLAARRTQDEIWLFCLIYCCIMALCAFFYRIENKSEKTQDKS